MLNQSVQGQFGDEEVISELQTDPVDGYDQIIVVDLPPLVTGERAASCQRRGPRKRFRDRICSCMCWGDQRSIDLHRLDELSDSVVTELTNYTRLSKKIFRRSR